MLALVGVIVFGLWLRYPLVGGGMPYFYSEDEGHHFNRLVNMKGDVYDPFVGSGTTVIAGEQEGRIVYAIEIEPAYGDVTVTRWEDFTGRKAKRLTKRYGK